LKEAIFANNKQVKHSVRPELKPLPDFGRKKQPWGLISIPAQAGMISNPRFIVGRKVESSCQQISAQFSVF
jgi:hypothetical protein